MLVPPNPLCFSLGGHIEYPTYTPQINSVLNMKYLYPGELKHQIFEFARSYRWNGKKSRKSFSEDFIVSQSVFERDRIPSGTLRKVIEVASEVVPADRFE